MFNSILNYFQRWRVLDVHHEEAISRFVFSKRLISFKNQRLKHSAFLPPKRDPNNISVFRIDKLVESYIWCLAQKYVGRKRQKAVIGRGDLLVQNVYKLDFSEIGLVDNSITVKKCTKSHLKHANIQYPKGLDDLKRRHIANKISMESKLVIPPREISEDIC